MDESTEKKPKGKRTVKKSPEKTDGYDLKMEILMLKLEGGFDSFEQAWTQARIKNGAHPHTIFAEDREYKSMIAPKYPTYVGHSSIGETDVKAEVMLYGLTLKNVMDSAIRMLKEYSSINTINF